MPQPHCNACAVHPPGHACLSHTCPDCGSINRHGVNPVLIHFPGCS